VFLVFMVPIPGFIAGVLSHPLQRVGTIASTYLIETFGIYAEAEGNVILLAEAQLGVDEVCSGLRMLMLFFTVCAGAAFLMRRSAIETIIILLSAIPIGVMANVARITVTAVLYETAYPGLAEAMYHDVPGWFMIPLAVVLLWTEVILLDRVFLKPTGEGALSPLAAFEGSVRRDRSAGLSKARS